MTSGASLVDLSPLLSFLAAGALVALLPLGWWWLRRNRQDRIHGQTTLALLTLFLTFDLVLFGAFTRLSDSGLGCPDWPGCYASASPFGARHEINQAQVHMPSGPVTTFKAWVEMIHRYLATAVGMLIAVLCARAWWTHSSQRHLNGSRSQHPWLASLCLVWVCIVGAFGAFTVTLKLQPIIVTLHLLGALVLLCLLLLQVLQLRRYSTPASVPSPKQWKAPKGWAWILALAFGVLWLQIGLGAWVSTNYAVLACNTFPDCNGSWWPTMNFEQGFTLWRKLGYTADGQLLDFNALVAIHYTHRIVAVGALSILAFVTWLLFCGGQVRAAAALATIAALQLLTGLINVVLQWPLLSALMHTAGAAALVLLLCWQLYLLWSKPSPAQSLRPISLSLR